MEDIRIIKKPNNDQFEFLKNHLSKERYLSEDKFYSTLFETGKPLKGIWLFISGDKYLGFLQTREHTPIIEIVVFSISYFMRSKGIGSEILRMVQREFLKKGYLAISLNSMNEYSDKFWINNGFISPEVPTSFSVENKTLIKIISNGLQPEKRISTNTTIELWDVDQYLSNDIDPRWVWNIPKNYNLTDTPIIHYCDSYWPIRITLEGNVIFEKRRLSYLNRGKNSINGFLILQSLKIIE